MYKHYKKSYKVKTYAKNHFLQSAFETDPCINNGTCTNRANGYNCSCPPGHSGERCKKGYKELLANSFLLISNN